MSEYIHEDITLRIVGDHPHAGELCHPIGKGPETITEMPYGYHVKLVNCPHKTEESYVLRKNLQMVQRPAPRVKVSIKKFRGE